MNIQKYQSWAFARKPAYLHRLADFEYEVFYALWLDSKHQVLKALELFYGTAGGASVYLREVIKEGLACNAAAIICGWTAFDTGLVMNDFCLTLILDW